MKLKSCVLGLASCVLLLAGCDKQATLFSSIDESQANSVMAALLGNGIDCEKTPGEEGTWNVLIAQGNFAAAVGLCEQLGLPRRPFMGVGEVFKKTGMVSSPSE